jgi:hypothetical protein
MRARPIPRNFSSGELAPWLDGLPGDLTQHGLLTCENFIVKKQGAIQRRPGSFYVAEVKNSASQTLLVQCEIDSSNIYVIEMGNLYCRFYKNHVQVSLAAAVYELATPYSTGDLTDLRWTYIPNEKALYFTCFNGQHPIRKLKWTSDNSWAMNIVPITATEKVISQITDGRNIFTYDFIKWEKGGVPSLQSFTRIKRGKNNWITCSYNNAKVFVSTDGISWLDVTPVGCPTSIFALEINKYGIGVLAGTGDKVFYTLDDGLSWIQSGATGYSNTYWCVAYDELIERWRVDGQGAGAGSINAIPASWTGTGGASGPDVREIIGYNGFWVGAGQAGSAASGSIYTAGSTCAPWSLVLSVAGDCFKTLARGTPGGIPIWVAITVTNGWVYTSASGTIWTRIATLGSYGTDLIWYKNRFIGWNKNVLWTSDTGTSWTSTVVSVAPAITDICQTAYNYRDEDEWFDQSSHYPRYLTYHEGRLMVGPTLEKPSTLWGSMTKIFNNFYIGQYSDQAFSYDLVSGRNVAIQWMVGGTELAIGTRTAEGVLRGSEEEGITPQTARMQWQSSFGSDNIQPIRIHDTIIFTQRGGEIVRGYVPGAGQEAWKSPDLTAFADHIAKGGITSMDHQDDPQTIAHFVRTDGQSPGLTFEGTTRAWWRTKMGATLAGAGIIESIAVIPTSGAEDEIWAIVKWTVGAAVKRYIIYFDTMAITSKEAYHGLDCGYYNSAAGSATVYSASVPQLAGETVWAKINGSTIEKGLVVGVGGTLTISAINATKVHIGLPFTSWAQTMRIDQNSAWGSGLGLSKRTGNLNVWVHETIGGEFGPTTSVTEPVAYLSTTDLTTDCLSINYPGQWDRDGYIWCIQKDPLPMTVIAIAPDMEMGDR